MRGLRLTRVRGGPGGAVCGPRTETRPLGVIRRHFLLKGCDHGVGGLRTVELLVCHPLQLLQREMHLLVDVLVLLGLGASIETVRLPYGHGYELVRMLLT